jgi:TM2 domain-containing membrane protein YozV
VFPVILIICALAIFVPRLFTHRLSMSQSRDVGIAYLLLLLGGLLGLHKFYLNRPAWGVVYLLTGGLFVIGVLFDLVTLPAQVQTCNAELAGAGQFQPPPRGATSPPDAFARAKARMDAFTRRLDDLETLAYSQRRK